MDLEFSAKDLAFKQEVKSFIEKNWTPELKALFKDPSKAKEAQEEWMKRLDSKGWLTLNWPTEYGGPGLSLTEKYIFSNEIAAAECPGVLPFGVSMVAPVIYTFGSEEQKAEHLPGIKNVDVWWCQGYSEPGSGSDLASLQCKAERDGDHYIVNGTKTWTTLAQHADWIFCLVRTDFDCKPQAGISFLLIDMKTPGIEVKPIRLADGSYEVNSVFFTDVKVPVANRIGEENKGWTYAKVLLQHERTGIAGVASSKRGVRKLKQAAAQINNAGVSLAEEPEFIEKVAELELELTALEYTELRVLSAATSGGSAGVESSILKIKGVEIQQRITELMVEVSGYYALPFTGAFWGSNSQAIGPEFAENSAPHYLNLRKASIYGGSNEVQKNIISKMVLGLG